MCLMNITNMILTWSCSMATPPVICRAHISLCTFIAMTSCPSITPSSGREGSTRRRSLEGGCEGLFYGIKMDIHRDLLSDGIFNP